MKVVGVSGSPRHDSNSATIVKAALDAVEAKGAEVEFFDFSSLKIAGCSGCMYCKSKGVCVKKDDIAKVTDAIAQADAVVMCAPIYFHRYNSDFRALIDRMYAYIKPDFSCTMAAGKKAIVISTQGVADANAFKNETEWLGEVLTSYFKFNVIDKLIHVNGSAVKAADDLSFLEKVKTSADKL